VIDELRVVGSRCGPIEKALELLNLKEEDAHKASDRQLRVEKYITKTFPLTQADQAIKCAADKSTMKVQIICSES
jgi:D-serine dehydratase